MLSFMQRVFGLQLAHNDINSSDVNSCVLLPQQDAVLRKAPEMCLPTLPPTHSLPPAGKVDVVGMGKLGLLTDAYKDLIIKYKKNYLKMNVQRKPKLT